MNDAYLTREEFEQFSTIASESYQKASQAQCDTAMLKILHEGLSDDTTCLSQKINNLSELVGFIYSTLGVEIKDCNGNLRNASDLEQDLRLLNPKILLSFKELMQL